MQSPVVGGDPRVPPRTDTTAGWASRLPALGRRGEGWVAGQVAVIALAAVLGLVGPSWPASVAGVLIVAGAVLGAAGLTLLVGGGVALGSALTPMPKPREHGALRQDGVYGLCRHPMYGGGLVMATGWALGRSPIVFAAIVLGVVFFDLKSRREEVWLESRYPDYPSYRVRVRRRLVPWVL